MALSITPGYDFGVNEVPTNTKIKLMLDGMVLTGIPKGSVDSGLAGILYGWLTGSTMATLPDEGSTLFDINGRMYVKTATGVVSLYNSGWGGYETIRVKNGAELDSNRPNPQAVAEDNWYSRCESLTAANLDFDEVYMRAATNQSRTNITVPQVTTTSGTHTRYLLCGGIRTGILATTGTWPRNPRTNTDSAMCYNLEKSTINVNEMKPTEFPMFNDNTDGLGPVLGICGQEESNAARAPTFWYGNDMMVI